MDFNFLLLTIFVVGLNALWYWMKFILKDNNYPISWFWNHFQDIGNMLDLAKKTKDINKKRKYHLIIISLILGIILFLITALNTL